MKILIVDDEIYAREICRDFLTEAGYETTTAEDGIQALEILSKKKFEILLTDIQMPRMDGISLLKETRKRYPEMEVILITAYGALTSAIEAIRAGSYDYLTKPLSSDLLLNSVRRCKEKIELQEELREYQKKLIEKEKLAALGSVSAWLSHRMRNALSVISMCAHYLSGKELAHMPSELKEVIAAIIEKTRALERITSDLISYSRSYDLEKGIENVNEILEDVVESVLVQVQIQKVNVLKQLDPSVPGIPCDAHLLHEVFENIVVNALQAIGVQRNQQIIIRTETFSGSTNLLFPEFKNGFIKVSVTNTGSSIPGDVKDKVFTPFFTTKENGSGLGLAIVKRIVEQHEGKVLVESEEKGGQKTTTVSMIFPMGPSAVLSTA